MRSLPTRHRPRAGQKPRSRKEESKGHKDPLPLPQAGGLKRPRVAGSGSRPRRQRHAKPFSECQQFKDICPHTSVPQSWREQLVPSLAPRLKLAPCPLGSREWLKSPFPTWLNSDLVGILPRASPGIGWSVGSQAPPVRRDSPECHLDVSGSRASRSHRECPAHNLRSPGASRMVAQSDPISTWDPPVYERRD